VGRNPREQRFRAIYDQGQPRLIRFALRRVTTPEDAADVVAETFAIAWRKLDRIPDGDAALVWLFATGRNVIANLHRRDVRRSELVQRLGNELVEAVRNSHLPEEGTAVVAGQALSHLSDEDRETLMLVAWDGVAISQLGAVLGCSPTVARVRLHRARTRLKRALAAEDVDVKHVSGNEHLHSQRTRPAETFEEEPS
jgi:RNA polymerase sigma factor (sigma-70 family)